MAVGRNTIDGKKLMSFVERIEVETKKRCDIDDNIRLIKAEARAQGFKEKGIGFLVKVRKQKPSEFRENEDLRDLYLHAAGLADDPPLFKYVESLGRDALGREQLIERM